MRGSGKMKTLRAQAFGLAILASAVVSFAFPRAFDTWGVNHKF